MYIYTIYLHVYIHTIARALFLGISLWHTHAGMHTHTCTFALPPSLAPSFPPSLPGEGGREGFAVGVIRGAEGPRRLLRC
jgi:hypothetical protein